MPPPPLPTLIKATCTLLLLDASTCRVSLALTGVHSSVTGGVARGGVGSIAVKFDGHQIFTLEELSAEFPHHSPQLAEERNKVKQKLERQTNSIV